MLLSRVRERSVHRKCFRCGTLRAQCWFDVYMYCFSSRVLLDNFPTFSSESGARILRSILVLLGLSSAGFACADTPRAVFSSFVGISFDVFHAGST